MKITIQDARTSVTLQQRDFRVTISGARGPAGPQGDPGEGGEWGTIVGDITEQTDLYTALQSKVPYTGATQDVNLGEYGAQLGNLEFDNTPTNVPTTAGSVYWNDTDGTLNIVLKGGQTISRVGETQHIRALNNTGAQIARGKVVYVVGAQGQRLTIGLADADTEILSKDTIGFTAEAIADGAEGFVIVQGVINNVSTTGMTDGATVYLSQTAGGYTTTAPTDPAHLVVLGFIVNGGSGGAGSIYVKVDNGYELEELHGVADAAKVTPVGADALLLRDSEDNNLWKRLTWTNALAGVKSHMDTFKSVAGGYASLDGSGKVPASELPSYVDDVVEVANYAALPGTGEAGKIYVTLDTNKCYRWTGSVYVEVSAGGASAWGAITGTLSNQTDLQTALDGKVDENAAITGATKTKITFDAKGLVTAGADAAIADITGLQTALDGKQATLSLTTTGTSGAATLVGSTLNIPQYQGVLTNPVTGTGTAGQVAYFSGTSAVTASSSLQYNDSSKTLYTQHTLGGTYEGFYVQNLSTATNATTVLRARDNSTGLCEFGLGGTGHSSLSNTGYFFTNKSQLSFYANSGLRMAINTTEIQLIGTGNTSATNSLKATNAAGTSLLIVRNDGPVLVNNTDGTGRLTVRGSGTTSATTALLVQNSTPSELFKVLDNGEVSVAALSSVATFKIGTTTFSDNSITSIITTTPNRNFWISPRISNNTYGFNVQNRDNIIDTSGTLLLSGFASTFAPTSGTAIYSNTVIYPTINQTGGANGITRGLYVNPTLTAAADWRGIESVASSNANHTLLKLRNATVDVLTVKADSKIGFWNATPVAQPTTGIAEAAFVENSGGTAVNVDSTFAGYTIQQIAQALKDIGLLA